MPSKNIVSREDYITLKAFISAARTLCYASSDTSLVPAANDVLDRMIWFVEEKLSYDPDFDEVNCK